MGGIHAREWISPAVATFIVRELVEDYAEHPSYIDNINWYFLPSANPDGYWRKNRAPNSGSSCYGTDLNLQTFETLSSLSTLFLSSDTPSTHTRSCGCGPTAMTMERTLKTTRRSSSWLSTPAMHSSRFTAPSLTQSTLLISIRPQELLMTGTNLLE